MRTIDISGGEMSDNIYCVDLGDGEVCWNVTRITRDARAGLFGEPLQWRGPLPPPDPRVHQNCDRAKIELFKKRPDILAIPVLAIEGRPVPDTVSIETFVDGNHRLVAIYENGSGSFQFYLVPRAIERSYRVTFKVS
jgi:hypothetical protein